MVEKCWVVQQYAPYMGIDYWFDITMPFKRAKLARYWYKWLSKRYKPTYRVMRVWRKLSVEW
jgi:hypothetical protein